MEILLWRHAEAEEGLPDLDRALTPRGRRQAEAMARWLDKRLDPAARVMVSPARRAQQTAAWLKREFATVPEIAPGASVAVACEVAGWPEADGTVLLVGHQPTLGLLASQILFGEARDFSLKKGGLIWIGGRSRDGRIQAVLKAAITPELL